MHLIFLGTCSGTEPIAGYHHSSIALSHNGGLYWIDAGESCSYTAHVNGLDLLATRGIFITHTHMDHIGGLPNLLWTLRKLEIGRRGKTAGLAGRCIDIRIPNMGTWAAIESLLQATEGDFRIPFTLHAEGYGDGVIFQRDGLTVTALHNRHMGAPTGGEPWRSFSLALTDGRRKVVVSGDVSHVSEVEPLLDGADLFLMETGHHRADEVCAYLRDIGKPIGRVGFTHHGRAILKDREGELRKARAILGPRVFFADEGMAVDLTADRSA